MNKNWYIINRDWVVITVCQNLDHAWEVVERMSKCGMIVTVASEEEFEKKEFEILGGNNAA